MPAERKKRVLRWSIIWAIAFLVLALVPAVPMYKGDTNIGPVPLLPFYVDKPTRDLPLLWPYVLGHVAVTTLIAAQVAARRGKEPRDDGAPEQRTSSP